jgi:sugar lactone lactonase YvrE
MTIDTEGNLWIAFGESGCIVCISSQTGEELQRIELPVKRPTSCAFGGKDLAELYVTTRVETGEGASEHHGGLFVIKNLGVCGAAPDFLYKL